MASDQRRHPEPEEPGERDVMPRSRLLLAYLVGLLLPLATAALLVPFREDHGRAMAIVLVVPVLVTASLGATGPAVVAALSAGLAYDVLLTRPYQQLAIDDPDDVVAAIVLVVVALVVGVSSSRLLRLRARSAARQTELHHLVGFADAVAREPSFDELAAEACGRIAALLGLQECRWSVGRLGGDRPVLLPDGNVMGYITALNPDRAKLPPEVELPAVAGTTAVGHFVLVSDGTCLTSYEERLTAATIATLFAAAAPGERTGIAGDGEREA
jgi:hypothetical protein